MRADDVFSTQCSKSEVKTLHSKYLNVLQFTKSPKLKYFHKMGLHMLEEQVLLIINILPKMKYKSLAQKYKPESMNR